ncbi:hypothetical protein HPB48_002103 [Haemaphysalis longicornis]|uniref:Transposable element P transposase-like RNase H domain-containing protein n=1 Tax=Haemaphysalis longicornis TaxID=44386 RepID=A0A9J6FGM4_HAELO|nr:hypothetical protein HPB48_002103 [Haemaphysalis longicornis]
MRKKCPKLYKHIRKNYIMVLPSKICLHKYMKGYQSSFSLNENAFALITEKAKDLDEFERHGGILIDEMKLLECLKGTSSGSGFVDLGAYISLRQAMETCDNGLVVLFQPLAIFRQLSTDSWHLQVTLQLKGRHSLQLIIIDTTLTAENSGLFLGLV